MKELEWKKTLISRY